MSSEEAAAYVIEQHVPDLTTGSRQEQLRHWAAEALSIANDQNHWQVLRLLRSRGFQSDSRWVATQLRISVDQVNVVLSRLLRLRLMEIAPGGKWKAIATPLCRTEAEFRKLALIRVRELAAGSGVALSNGAAKSSQ
jgi:hypothetical protein